jgi:hypothetical protein
MLSGRNRIYMFTVECRCTTIWNYELRGNCFESQAEIFMEGGKRFSLVSFGRLMFFFFFKKKFIAPENGSI